MKTKQRSILTLIVVILTLAACTTPAEPAGTQEAAGGACPTPAGDQALLMKAEEGYCLLYPTEHNTANVSSFVVINPATEPGDVLGDAWAQIVVTDAEGRTAAEIADEEITPFGADFNITRVEEQAGGEPAIIVDGLPGPDPWRKVFIVHDGRLYTLTFLPWFPSEGNSDQPRPLENLYDTVMSSIHFLPPTQPLPTPTQPWGSGNLPPAITFVLPFDGQVLNFEDDLYFKVNELAGAEGYLWSFSQNGVVVWENLRDEFGYTAGGTYAILAGSEAHSRLVPGPLQVSVSAKKGDFLTDPTVITITLE